MINSLFAEAPLRGHPDKAADIVADSILDACLVVDPFSRVGCEVLIAKQFVCIAGEITTEANLDFDEIARVTLQNLGYNCSASGLDASSCEIRLSLSKQSPSIRSAMIDTQSRLCAGDQCVVTGYAIDNVFGCIPVETAMAKRLAIEIDNARNAGRFPFLYPDGKVLVGISNNNDPQIELISISVHHNADFHECKLLAEMEQFLRNDINLGLPINEYTRIRVNPPNGSFVLGGPVADTGLTGRKIIASAYGPRVPHGGGAFSGKDPTKLDRTGAYGARFVARQLVNAKLASEILVTIAYEMGSLEPVSVVLEAPDCNISWKDVCEMCGDLRDLSPHSLINYFEMRNPIYTKSTLLYHFGMSNQLPWESDFKK